MPENLIKLFAELDGPLRHAITARRGLRREWCAWRIVISPGTGMNNVTSPRCMLFISRALLILANHSPSKIGIGFELPARSIAPRAPLIMFRKVG